MNTVCIIPARGGSVRIPRKNLRLFYGKPIIAYSIDLALNSGLFDRVIVSTDDDEIEQVAKEYGAEVIRRPTCDGTMGTQELMAQALKNIDCKFACCLYATAPLLTGADIFYGLAEVHEDYTFFAMSVCEDPLSDAGGFYCGRRRAFIERAPLIAPHTAMIPLPANRVCDINTIDDWNRAEQLYKENHERNS